MAENIIDDSDQEPPTYVPDRRERLLNLLAALIETREVRWEPQFVFALTWLVFVLSLGAFLWPFRFAIKACGALHRGN